MKLTLSTGGALAALAVALAFTSVPAAAQPNDHHDNHGWQRSGDSGQHDRGQSHGEGRAAPQQRNFTPQARPERVAPQAQQAQRNWSPQAREQHGWNGQAREQQQRTYTPQARDEQRSWSGRNGQQVERNRTYVDRERNTTYQNAYRGGHNRTYRDTYNGSRQWNRNWRNDNRYDWQRYRSSNRNVYHVGRYYAPYRNYSYRRLSIGFALDPLFFGQDYWIGDPGYYRLPAVYGPYRWVRYYDDAVLVDIYSGEVVDVIYDFFW